MNLDFEEAVRRVAQWGRVDVGPQVAVKHLRLLANRGLMPVEALKQIGPVRPVEIRFIDWEIVILRYADAWSEMSDAAASDERAAASVTKQPHGGKCDADLPEQLQI